MQATAVVETAPGRSYHGSGGNIQKDEPSDPKKENLLSSNGCNEAELTFLDDDWDSLALEQRANDKKLSNIDKADLLEPSFTTNLDTNEESTHSQSSEFEDSIDYAFLNKTYSIHYSESKLKNKSLIHLNSELDSKMQEREEVFFDILEHQGNKVIGLERIFKISDDDYKETAEDRQKCDADEDSQQEYHSAEEQDYLSDRLSVDRTKTLNVSNLEVVGLRNSGYGVKYASNLEVNHVTLESSSSFSSDSIEVYGQEDSPHVSKFQNSVTLRDSHEPKPAEGKQQETSLLYHMVFDEIVLRSSPPENQESQSKSGFVNPQRALKTKISTGKLKSEVTETKDFCGGAIVENEMLHLENPSTPPQNKALEVFLQPCEDCQTSWTSFFDDSVISACGYSHYKSLQNTPNSALDLSVAPPRTGVKDDEAIREESSPKVADASATNETCFHSVEETLPESEPGAGKRVVMVNQTVDVSTDFRACFTTSRATSARPSVVSTSSNTEITMMNKKRPGEWHSEKQRSVACNTDWSYSQDREDAQMAMTKGPLGTSLSVDSLNPHRNFLNKDSLELRKTFATTDLKEHPEREPQPSHAMEENAPSACCQNVTQRAVQAELHLVDVHYRMCRHNCSDIYKLVVEDREGLNRNLSSNSKKELGSALLSVLGDLKVRYTSLKEKINKGIPLEELPPLSVESKLLSAFAIFASRLMKKEPHIFSGADSELDNQSTRDAGVSSSLTKTLPQVSLLSDTSQPKQGTLPKEDGLKNDDIDVCFSQLKLDDKDCKNNQEVSEDWFDAKENLTGIDGSGIQGSQTEQDGGDATCALEIRHVEPVRRDKGYLIHVGGLCPSVSEADLRFHFQKYQVSDISVYDSSTNYRYASLTLKKNNDAKMAVKEMNGREINGKSVNVRLVKTPGEYTSPLSSKNGNRGSLNNLEKSASKEVSAASSVSRLPRTRPRQPGSEQDSEFVHFDQKGIKKNCKQIESTRLLPDPPVQFIPPNTLNLRSFTKIMKRLTELHPEVSRDHIIDALQEVRINHKGFLNGLSINTIVEMTSSVLKNSASR
ncbi:RNA-binding protein 44 isoform X2 [Rousettus aegyptiacus]|uniref:RNA binding motif protein 44 n=1 Tax=Rousettus aegyptiacus TaxID=9407 RepID=A0A7J8JLP6_ROUAE|nr:RNA-binding protein 44 isoform X2 [Rousettus aegyptiacus]KAF6497441.1 RNA binding motif protein 44 [Rousettus aegyptiacus]